MSMKKPYEFAQVLSVIDPDNQSASTVTGDWVKADKFQSYLALFNIGIMASTGTCVFSVQQATDASGTGAKAIKTATTLTEAGTDSDKQVVISFDSSDMDTAGGFLWFAPRCLTATAASYVSAVIVGINPIYGYDMANDLSSVDEIVT